jgi:pyridoxal phosphate enzyme (YggS family)
VQKLLPFRKPSLLKLFKLFYNKGQRLFGENKVQELCDKAAVLPKDIEWHLIGHLQSNKVKYIAPFVSLIHAVDSEKLLEEINKQAIKCNRVIPCLLQIHIAKEETKFGFSEEEVLDMLSTISFQSFSHIEIHGLMGMATNTDNIATNRTGV